MTELKLKNQVGILIILANLAIIILVLVLFVMGGFLFDEMTTIIALTVPMFSVYTTAILKNIVSTRTEIAVDDGPTVTTQYTFVSWLIPSAFCVYLGTIILLKALNVGFSSFEQFKVMLVASETIFGAYVGIVLSSMFELPKKKT